MDQSHENSGLVIVGTIWDSRIRWAILYTGTVTPHRPENEKTEKKLYSWMRRRLDRRRCRRVTLGEFTLGGQRTYIASVLNH